MRPIFLVGGGSGGHVQPNRAVASALLKQSSEQCAFQPIFICSKAAIDREILEAAQVRFIPLFSGKLRRYFHPRIFVDWMLIILGFGQSLWLLIRYRPALVFCKGGYVCVPMALAASLIRIPIIAHESDMVPGLANRIIARFASTVCSGFPLNIFPKYVFTGNPLRMEMLVPPSDAPEKAYEFTKLDPNLPIILVMGGSQGAEWINQAIFKILPELLKKYQVVHLTGQGKEGEFQHPRYRQYPYLQDELQWMYSIASLVISRSGAGSLAELAFFGLPAILIPLPAAANNHQQKNAEYFAQRGAAEIITQLPINIPKIALAIDQLFVNEAKRTAMGQAMRALATPDAAERIAGELLKCIPV